MTKSTKMWSVIDVYYKHGEASLHSFITEDDLRDFLIEKLEYYSEYQDLEEDIYEYSDIKSLIKRTIELGNKHIEEQWGSGVTAVHKLNFKTQKIVVYE